MSRILVVDDEPSVVVALTEILEDDGHEVTHAYDGAEALERARASRPELILLDQTMPVADGWAFLRQTERDAQLANVPVVMMTVTDPRRDQSARVRQTLTKPFELEELLEAVSEALDRPAG